MEIPFFTWCIMDELEKAGYRAYIVGGAVRDMVLGKTPHDYDIATNATPEQVRNILRGKTNIVDKNGERFGTVVAREGDEEYEITTFRKEAGYSDGRHPSQVSFSDTIEEDLSRRDFTVNAMAMSKDGEIIDPFNGRKDLETGTLRCVGDPNERFAEDSLRILRAARFAAKYDFSIESKTFLGMLNNKNGIKKLSAERVREELTKMLLLDNPSSAFVVLPAVGALSTVLPEFYACFDQEQGSNRHCLDSSVAEHSLNVTSKLPKKSEIRWAGLLHDIGKIPCAVYKNGHVSFPDHSLKSTEMAEEILKRLKFSNKEAEEILFLIKNHDLHLSKDWKIREFAGKNPKEWLKELFLLKDADARDHAPEFVEDFVRGNNALRDKINGFIEDGSAITVKDLAINGTDLMGIGVLGPTIKEFQKEALRECLVNPEHNTKEWLLNFAGRFTGKNGNRPEDTLDDNEPEL